MQTQTHTDDYVNIERISLPCPGCEKNMVRTSKEVLGKLQPIGRTDYSFVCDCGTTQTVVVPHKSS